MKNAKITAIKLLRTAKQASEHLALKAKVLTNARHPSHNMNGARTDNACSLIISAQSNAIGARTFIQRELVPDGDLGAGRVNQGHVGQLATDETQVVVQRQEPKGYWKPMGLLRNLI